MMMALVAALGVAVYFNYTMSADKDPSTDASTEPPAVEDHLGDATFVGAEQGGILGAALATLGVVLPSFIVILIVAAILKSFRNNPMVDRAFYGLRPASAGLIAAAGISVAVSNLFYPNAFAQGLYWLSVNWKGLALAVVLWVLTNKVKKTKNLHPIVFIGASAVVGILLSMG
mgnify:CR=1 FL=1